MRTKKTNAKKVTAFEAEKAVVQGCTFEGEVLERLKDWARTSYCSVAGDRLSEQLQQLNITGIHLVENEILTGEGKVVKLIPARNALTGPYYPLILVEDSVCQYTYAIVSKEQFYLETFKKYSSDGATVTFFFKKNNNISLKPSITVRKGNWELIASVDGELDSRIPLLEDKLLELNLTKELTPKTVYEVLSKHFNVPMTITFDWLQHPYVYGIWKTTVVKGECKVYRKYLRNNNMSEYYKYLEVDKDENSFCYRTDTEVYELKNGKFVFKTSSSNPCEMFEICKNEIEKFRSEMENLLG